MSFKGIVKIKNTVRYSDFPYPKEFIQGKELLLIEQNKNGNCVCLWGFHGITTIKEQDIEKITFNQFVDSSKYIKQFYTPETVEALNTYIPKLTKETL